MSEIFLNGKIELHCGDCLAVLPTLAENSIDACVTDPPYHLTSIVKRFGGNGAAPAQFGNDGRFARASAGFMGKQWDGGDIAFCPEVWREVWRVLKPGAHLLAFGGTRTYHRMACAIEDAGFEIRDCIQWIYGSGFPKSHAVDKHIDRQAGAKRNKKHVPTWRMNPSNWKVKNGGQASHWIAEARARGEKFVEISDDEPTTDAARQWQGWGTALKPACEMIVFARKPLSEGTVAANVLKHGVGALNIDGTRIPCEPIYRTRNTALGIMNDDGWQPKSAISVNTNGRWPSNLIHDGSEEVLAGFPEVHSAGSQRDLQYDGTYTDDDRLVYGAGIGVSRKGFRVGDDSGSAARFFYTAKADADDRLGSKHPTVKPLDLMQYLCRLVCPKDGVVLDPFSGTGTTGEAAWREGMRAMLIEREAEYQADIRRRMALCLAGPDERVREAIKERMKDKPVDHGPLFAGGYE